MQRSTRAERLAARDALARAIDERAPEPTFQKLFALNPFLLTESLPLRLHSTNLRVMGRPGRSEPDFVVYPSTGAHGNYSVIEIKRPDSKILTRPRKGVVILSRSAQTAVAQAEKYAADLLAGTAQGNAISILGSRTDLFIIMGLSSELADASLRLMARQEIDRLFPRNCQLLTFDGLLEVIDESVVPRVHILVPNWAALEGGRKQQPGKCLNGHSNPPGVSLCLICDRAIASDLPLSNLGRSLGVLRFQGKEFDVRRSVAIGRDPRPPVADSAQWDSLTIRDPKNEVSLQHVELQAHGGQILAMDTNSTNGTEMVSYEGWKRRLAPGRPVILQHGITLRLAETLDVLYDWPQ